MGVEFHSSEIHHLNVRKDSSLQNSGKEKDKRETQRRL